MATITLNYNPRNKTAKTLIETIVKLGLASVEEKDSPYNKKFVEKIRKAEKSEGEKIGTGDLWK
ncbi:MAG: hypothetical protein BGN96_06390 [Bacteroidales bacterium 45-6]|nr:MAG: hypothetical protein BGN96_06390 [Bacteroidales bacterium 45-6]